MLVLLPLNIKWASIYGRVLAGSWRRRGLVSHASVGEALFAIAADLPARPDEPVEGLADNAEL